MLQRDPLRIRLAEWRSSPELTSAARKVFAMPEANYMLDVVRNEHPGFNVLPDDAPPQARIAHQCRAEGYTMAIANLEAMSRFEQQRQNVEATFEEEEAQKE